LNHRSALLNIFDLCHPFAIVLTNIYCIASNLFIDGTSVLSHEGTTQGDPLAIPMYTISLLPVIQRLSLRASPNRFGMWMMGVHFVSWRCGRKSCVLSVAPLGAMLMQSSAGWLPRKVCFREPIMFSQELVHVQVTSTGCPYLGAALDSTTFTNLFTQQHVSEWIYGVSHLSTFGETQPRMLLLTVILNYYIFVPPQSLAATPLKNHIAHQMLRQDY